MKKLLLTLVACLVAIAANAWTVKFTNPDGWSTPYIWAWIEGGSNFTGGNWPGQPMTKDSDGTWSFTYSGPIAGVPEKVIFSNNGKPQTGNLNFEDGATYDLNGPVGAVKYKYTVYFDNTNNWPYVNIYGWGSMGYTAGWPGSEMQKGSNGLYEFSFETTDPNPPVIGDGDGFLFYGGDDSKKTPDIKSFTNGATYYPNGTTTPPPAELTFYVIGDDVDGQSWALMTNQMTKTANGVYQWTGQKLGNKFKINDGTWGAQYNIGKGDDGTIKIGTPYHYYMGDGSADIEFDGFNAVTDPTVVLNTNEGTITLTGTPVYGPPTIYIVGANINGNASWGVGSDNAMTYDESSNTYTWEGTTLGAGFKFFNGSWDGGYNIGASGDQVASVVLGTPYTVFNNGDSKDLQFAYPTISNPKVTLNIDENSLTVTGTGVAPSSMYILGNIDGSEFTLDTEVEMTANSGVFTISDVNVTVAEGGSVGYIQFATEKATTTEDAGWSELGLRLGPQTYNLAVELDETSLSASYNLASNGKNNYSFMLNPGVYNVEVNYTGAAPQVTFSQKPEPLYLMGYDEDGNVTLRQEMTPSSTDPKVYEYTYTVPNYSKGFKFYFSTTGKSEANNNFVPTVANQSIRFGADNTYKATWSNVGVGNAVDYVAGETTFRFNIETLECELKYEGALVNFEFTGVENAYYYVNMANLTGDDMVVYLNSNSVQYGIDKSDQTGLVASPKDGYTLKITCPEASVPNQNYFIQPGTGDEQMILLYPGAQGYTFTFTVSEKVEAEPVYSFKGQVRNFDFEVDGNTLTYFGVLGPQTFVIEKKVGEEVQTTYYGPGITGFGNYTGNTTSEGPWNLSADVVNVNGSPIMLTFNLDDLVLTVSTGLTASAGTADTQQSGTIENGAASGTINLVSNQDYAWVFFNIPEEATAVYYKVTNVNPLTNARRNAAPEGYQEADTWEWDSPEKGSYYAQLLSGTSGTLDVIYEIYGAQSKPTTYDYTVTKSVPTGINGIDADEEGAEYYTIDGVKVLNPERGIFIRVQNGNVTKVVK